MSSLLRWPVKPYQGIRIRDSWGEGHFGASRGGRKHKGLDLLAQPFDLIVAPCNLKVTRIGQAYADTKRLHSLHFEGWNSWIGYRFKLLYVEPERRVGEIVLQSMPIGITESVSAYHSERKPTHPGKMLNHVHFEVYQRLDSDGSPSRSGRWVQIDPKPFLEVPEETPRGIMELPIV